MDSETEKGPRSKFRTAPVLHSRTTQLWGLYVFLHLEFYNHTLLDANSTFQCHLTVRGSTFPDMIYWWPPTSKGGPFHSLLVLFLFCINNCCNNLWSTQVTGVLEVVNRQKVFFWDLMVSVLQTKLTHYDLEWKGGPVKWFNQTSSAGLDKSKPVV